MAISEFALIRDYFAQATISRDDVLLGIGDDCALLQPPAGALLAVSMDTLVAGRHFLHDVDPRSLGHKSLAVNLSDLAAMGAVPGWVTLSISLQQPDPVWLAAFMRGFSSLANQHGVQLVGGDTTSGPLSITVQAHGFVDPAKALRRDAARPGDLLYVSGTLGDAGLALKMLQGQFDPGLLPAVRERLERPQPRLALGQALAGVAHAAIDLSDGLSSDLQHVCAASGVGATVELDKLPLSTAVTEYLQSARDWSLPLASGDDYELLFTLPIEQQAALDALQLDVSLTCIGRIDQQPGMRFVQADGDEIQRIPAGYDHFS